MSKVTYRAFLPPLALPASLPAAVALDHLGVAIEPARGLDGRPLRAEG